MGQADERSSRAMGIFESLVAGAAWENYSIALLVTHPLEHLGSNTEKPSSIQAGVVSQVLVGSQRPHGS